jgi:hypothetical protein
MPRTASLFTLEKNALFAVIGFALGALGFSLWGNAPSTFSGEPVRIAAAPQGEHCAAATAEETDDIFFLSCGGIF